MAGDFVTAANRRRGADAERSEWLFIVDHLGRPTTANKAHNMHHRAVSADRKRWREAGFALAAVKGIPTCEAITVECWGRYPNRAALPDADAIAPALKGFLDGLVDAGVVADDSGAFVRSITYRAPVVEPGDPAMVVLVRRFDALDGAA